MGYIPDDAEWYLADIVLEITVEDDPRNVIHTNSVLVRADSPEDAYEEALKLGAASESTYENVAGKQITFRFRGLRDLNVIHDELKHGAELTYSEDVGWDEARIQKWISPKEELGIFSPIMPTDKPDYRSGDIVRRLYQRYPDLRSDAGELSDE